MEKCRLAFSHAFHPIICVIPTRLYVSIYSFSFATSIFLSINDWSHDLHLLTLLEKRCIFTEEKCQTFLPAEFRLSLVQENSGGFSRVTQC